MLVSSKPMHCKNEMCLDLPSITAKHKVYQKRDTKTIMIYNHCKCRSKQNTNTVMSRYHTEDIRFFCKLCLLVDPVNLDTNRQTLQTTLVVVLCMWICSEKKAENIVLVLIFFRGIQATLSKYWDQVYVILPWFQHRSLSAT